jgi:hypothetical protein
MENENKISSQELEQRQQKVVRGKAVWQQRLQQVLCPKLQNIYGKLHAEEFVKKLVGEKGKLLTLKTKNARLPLSSISFSRSNPRLDLDGHGDVKSQEDLYKFIFEHYSIDKLASGIKQSGDTQESIVVNSDGENLEGNRRQCAYMYLYCMTGDEHWATIPVEMLSPQTQEAQKVALLLVRHAATGLAWTPPMKARYCKNVMKNLGLSSEEVGKLTGWGTKEVEKYLRAYGFLLQYQKTTGDKSSPEKFSFFNEIVHSPRLQRRMTEGKMVGKKKPVLPWIFENIKNNRISECRHIRKLPDILGCPEAITVMEKEGVEAALGMLGEGDGRLLKTLNRCCALVAKTQDFTATDKKAMKKLRGQLNGILD